MTIDISKTGLNAWETVTIIRKLAGLVWLVRSQIIHYVRENTRGIQETLYSYGVMVYFTAWPFPGRTTVHKT